MVDGLFCLYRNNLIKYCEMKRRDKNVKVKKKKKKKLKKFIVEISLRKDWKIIIEYYILNKIIDLVRKNLLIFRENKVV